MAKSAKSPFAEVSKIIGRVGEHHAEILILAEYSLPYEFPKSVEAYVASISEEISEKEMVSIDMQKVLTP